MGLFSRKKRRAPEPVQSFVGPVHAAAPAQGTSGHAGPSLATTNSALTSQPVAHGAPRTAPPAPSSRFLLPFKSNSDDRVQQQRTDPQQRYETADVESRASRDRGPRETYSAWHSQPPPQDDYRPSFDSTFSRPAHVDPLASEAAARGSTLSLPPARPSLDVGQRPRQASAGAPGVAADDQAKWSRWRIGRQPKPRQNSTGSGLYGSEVDDDGDDGSGFVVKSFRTVSRVHEDPVPPHPMPPFQGVEPQLPPPAPIPPTRSQFSRPSMDLQYEDAHQQQESLRPSLDLGSSDVGRPEQPRRPSLATLGKGRPPSQSWESGSGTISAEAFRVASARSKSAVSLASMDSPPLDSRPRFEPQRPQSRMSRRNSSFSEAGASILIPPRPSFAIGQHSNGSGSSIDSRSSSVSNSVATSPATTTSALPPSETQTIPLSASAGQSRQSLVSSERATSSPPAAAALRPRPAKRMSSGDSELRLIAAYGDMITASPPTQDRALPAIDTDLGSTARSTTSPLTTTSSERSSAHERGPSFSIQPPTPQARTEEPFNRPKRTSSLQPDSVGKALQAMGVGRPVSMQRPGAPAKTNTLPSTAGPSKGWNSDSSDEERLSTSDEESDDEVPLSTIRSRSQTNLALTASGLRSRTSFETTRGTETEALTDRMSRVAPFPTHQQKRMSQASMGVAPLARRGSNRRSVSTLSFSTSMTVSQAATTANTAAPALPPSPQRLPYQAPRSISNPTTASMRQPLTANSTAPSSLTDVTVSSALPSPSLQSVSRDRSSASSGSATTSSSFPQTPKDRSPETSALGVGIRSSHTPSQLGSHPSKPSVKFDLATAMSTVGGPRSQRLSMLGPASRSTPNLVPVNVSAALAPPVPSPFASPKYPSPSCQTGQNARAGQNEATPAPEGVIHDRLKARHRAEALRAMQIGRDLNDPSGLIPDGDAQESLLGGDASDENEPLANLPSRGSMIGGFGRGVGSGGSVMSGAGGAGAQMGMPSLPGLGMGGQYSQLAIPPPGVDPYLYASLPPDQKMSLHQRSQQMMAMMQEAAVRAKAESVMGGGGGSMMSGHSGSTRPTHQQSMSLGSYDAFGAAGGDMPYGYPPQHPMMMMMPQQQHMPAFAPSFAMSQPFFQPHFAQHQQHFYGMPSYAGSAIGFSGPAGPAQAAPSAIGIPSKASGMARRPVGHGRASSAIGTGYRG